MEHLDGPLMRCPSDGPHIKGSLLGEGRGPGKGIEEEKGAGQTEKDRKREERERREHGVLGAERSNSPFIASQSPNWLLLGNCWEEPRRNANFESLSTGCCALDPGLSKV